MFLCEKRVQFPQDFSCTPTWQPFHCIVHQWAAVTSCENNLYSKAMKPQTSSGPVSTLDIEAGFTLQCANKVVSNSLGASGFCYQASEFCS